MKIVAMFAVLLWGGCAHASGMVQAITAIANTVYTGSLTVSPSTGATLVMPKGVCFYEIRTSLDNSSTGWVKVSTVSMAQASADLGEETGWQVFGSGVNSYCVFSPPIVYNDGPQAKPITMYMLPSHGSLVVHYMYSAMLLIP